MAETRKIAAILAADVAGYSRLARADEDRTLARLRALRNDGGELNFAARINRPAVKARLRLSIADVDTIASRIRDNKQ